MDNCYYEKIGNEIKNITEEIPFDIPDNWTWMRIKDFAKVRNGFTPRRDNPNFWAKGTIPWFTIEDKKREGMFITSTIQHITPIATTEERIVPRNSVLLCCTASVGEVAYTKIDITTNQQFNGISINDEFHNVVSSLYLLYFALTLKNKLNNDLATATTFGFVSVSKVEKILVPIPPFNEQLKIINKIQTLLHILSSIEQEKNNLDNIINHVKFKILDYYFGENSCYKSYYKTNTKLSEILPPEVVGDGDWVLSEDMDEYGTINLVQLKHIGNLKYIYKSYNHVNKKFVKDKNCSIIKPGYLLINRLISDSLKCCLLPSIDNECITAVDICWIAPNDVVENEYLMYLLSSPTMQRQIQNKSSGSTRKRISKKNLMSIPVDIHTKEIQIKIINKIKYIFDILCSINS